MNMQAPMMQGMMGNYVEQSRNMFVKMQEQMAKQTEQHVPGLPGIQRRRSADVGRRLRSRGPRPQRAASIGDNRADERRSRCRYRAAASAAPEVGFVSLGCPKALTDSELILTQLSAEGYETSKTFEGADLVIVNTCGFIDDAVKESLDTIGEALAENGKVIVTGCLGAKAGDGGGNLVRQMHPRVLAVTGPHATQEVMDAVHAHLPKPHDPFVDLVPRRAIGIKLTPQALRLPEDQRRLQPPLHLLHHPVHARRPGQSRPIGDVLERGAGAVRGAA